MNIKKIIIVLIILFTLISVFSQDCDTLKRIFPRLPANIPKNINCRDSLGNKTGWWIECSIKEYEYEYLPGKFKTIQYVNYYSCGTYKENKKNDKWEYISSKNGAIYTDREEFYYQDGSVTEMKYFNYITSNFNLDSSIVNSKVVIHSHSDTVIIDCLNRNCVAKHQNINIIEFPLDYLDIQQFAFIIGVYNREIKIIKHKSKLHE